MLLLSVGPVVGRWWVDGTGGLGGDPGREDVAGVVGEVVSDERVEAVVLTGDVCGGDDDELSVAGGDGALGGAPEEVVGFVGQECGCDEKDRVVVGDCPLLDLVGGAALAADELADQGLVVVGHA
jgi:hypothetical protein